MNTVRGMAGGAGGRLVHYMTPVLMKHGIRAARLTEQRILQIVALIAECVGPGNAGRVPRRRSSGTRRCRDRIVLVPALQQVIVGRTMRTVRTCTVGGASGIVVVAISAIEIEARTL